MINYSQEENLPLIKELVSDCEYLGTPEKQEKLELELG
jgi:hypothetical protein